MPSTTATGLPYPLDTDAVQLGAQNIKNLADALDRRIKIVTATVDIPSSAAHTSALNIQVLIPGLAVGDYAFCLGAVGTSGMSFHMRTRGPCSIAGQITLDTYNADGSVNDPAAVGMVFLVIAHA